MGQTKVPTSSKSQNIYRNITDMRFQQSQKGIHDITSKRVPEKPWYVVFVERLPEMSEHIIGTSLKIDEHGQTKWIYILEL